MSKQNNDILFEEFIEQLSEVRYLPFLHKNMKLSPFVGRRVSKEATKMPGAIKGNEIHTMNHPSGNKGFFLSKDGVVNTHLVLTPRMVKKRGKTVPASYNVEVVSANEQSPGVHHLYHHLITKHDMVLTSDRQSLGGYKIWEKLSKMKGIGVHGYSRGKPVNVGTEDPEETHATVDDVIMARHEGDSNDLKDLVKKKNVMLVAHKLQEEAEPRLGKIVRTPGGPKKFMVKVKDPSTGNVKTVRFGDPNLSIKRDDPERRRSFRARHKCDQAKDRTTPRYWSCRQWRASTPVEG